MCPGIDATVNQVLLCKKISVPFGSDSVFACEVVTFTVSFN